jgi:hypothetical protein
LCAWIAVKPEGKFDREVKILMVPKRMEDRGATNLTLT